MDNLLNYCLLLDTSSPNCSVALSKDGELVAFKEVNEAHIHSRKLASYIREVLTEEGIATKDLHAVAVGKGPGSYTGLRIGVATAKSICYALNIPLVGINSLFSMAVQTREKVEEKSGFFAPMLDARRMEVFTAVFDARLNFYQETEAGVIDEHSFEKYLENDLVYFSGNGMPKAKQYLEKYANARFLENIWPSAPFMLDEAVRRLNIGEVEDISTFEPFYLKSIKTNQSQKVEKVLKS